MGRKCKTLKSKWPQKCAIVYGLHAPGGDIVYVGATRNAKRRFSSYRSHSGCHNKSLGEWLKKQPQVCVAVLHEGGEGLFAAEKREIKSRNGLFNLICGGDQAWREHAPKPWMARTGVLCPSAIALQRLAKAGHPCHSTIRKIAKARNETFADIDRVKYEVDLAQRLPPFNAIQMWVKAVAHKAIPALEADQHAR